MIDLSADAVPNSVTPSLIDFGSVMRPSTGGRLLRLDRAGNRFKCAVTLPVKRAEPARRIVADLIAAKTEGLRMYYPLLGVNQGYPGSPVVDGAGQSGTSLNVRGFRPYYAAKQGFWLSIVDAAGQHYLHNMRAQAVADGSGDATLSIRPMLRVPFPDGAVIHLARPMIEGLVDGNEMSWDLAIGGFVENLAFVIEETA